MKKMIVFALSLMMVFIFASCGKSMAERALDAVPSIEFERIAVVTQYPEIADMAKTRQFISVENRNPEYGISHTIELGLSVMDGMDGVMFMVSDQPLLNSRWIRGLTEKWRENPDKIVAAGHGGVRGNPCLFPRRFWGELLELGGDEGGSRVIRKHENALELVEIPAPELMDVDTKSALNEVKEYLEENETEGENCCRDRT